MNTARSRAAAVNLIINRYLNKDVCLDLKKLKCVCVFGGMGVGGWGVGAFRVIHS